MQQARHPAPVTGDQLVVGPEQVEGHEKTAPRQVFAVASIPTQEFQPLSQRRAEITGERVVCGEGVTRLVITTVLLEAPAQGRSVRLRGGGSRESQQGTQPAQTFVLGRDGFESRQRRLR